MIVKKINSKILDENCYIVSNGKKCLVIDPGAGTKDEINNYISRERIEIESVLLTHGHFDHTWDTPFFKNTLIYCNRNDKYFIDNPIKIFDQGGLSQRINLEIGRDDTKLIIPTPEYITIQDYQAVNFRIGNFKITAISLPGHSEGSTAYKIDNDIFFGDVIFDESYGRTDLYLSNPEKMKISLQNVMSMQSKLHCYPGHYNDFILEKWQNFFRNTFNI